MKNFARKMVSQTEASLQDLKRLCRYLIRKPDVCQVFARQTRPNKLRIQIDSDHAGDIITRRSTTGIALYGLHMLQHSSNVQLTIALSTGELEYHALAKRGSIGLGLQKGIIHRASLGKTRHIQTRFLWLQERVSMDHLRVEYIPRKTNRANAPTKNIPSIQINAIKNNSSSWRAKVPGQIPLPDCYTSVYRATLPAKRSDKIYRFKDPIYNLYFGSKEKYAP